MAILHPLGFISKSFQIWDHFFRLLFLKGSENLKSLNIGLQEVGTKKHLNGVNKWKNSVKKTFSPRQFYTFYEQKCSNLSQILTPFLLTTFPKGFQKSKKCWHWTLRSGGKKTHKRSEKHRYQEHYCSVRQNSPNNNKKNARRFYTPY